MIRPMGKLTQTAKTRWSA